MNLSKIVIVGRSKKDSRVIYALEALPEELIPKTIRTLAVDYAVSEAAIPKKSEDNGGGVVRVAFQNRFDFSLPKDARWINERFGIFVYKDTRYQFQFM